MSEPEYPLSRRANRAAEQRGRAPRQKREEAKTASPTGRRTVWLASSLGVAFLLVATGALFAGAAVGSANTLGTPTASNSAIPERSVPVDLPLATKLRTCSVSPLAADPRLVKLSGAVVNASTGELLFDRAADTGIAQGGAQRILTAAAALNILGPDAVLTTRVYEGSSPNTIVLVGAGDPTLSAVHTGDSVYAGAPKLDELAAKVKLAYSADVENIVLDSSLWSSSDKWNATWKRSEQTQGTISEVTALQVDGDRQDPRVQLSPRSTDPVANAGRQFAEAMGLDPDDVTFSLGSAVTSKPLLASVNSQPVSVLVSQMLVQSDLTLAESLSRLVSKSMGLGGTGVSLQQAIPQSLAVYNVKPEGLVIQDGSGLSPLNSVPPKFVAALMSSVLAGGNNLNHVYNSLSISGKSGNLAKRLAGSPAQGSVIGMAARTNAGYNMVGTVTAADGTPLAFAFYADGKGVKESAKPALDALVTGVYSCGANLSNN